MACPDQDCHQKLADTCKLVHSSTEGLPSKVAKTSMTKWVIAIIGFGLTIVGFIITISIILSSSVSNSLATAKDEIKQNKQDVAIVANTMQLGFDRMNEKLDSVVESQRRIWKAVKNKPDNE